MTTGAAALSRLARWAFPAPPLPPTGPTRTFAGFPFVAPPISATPGGASGTPATARGHADVYRSLPLVFRCLNLVAHAASVAPVRVYDEAQDNAELPDHPLRLLLRQPNPQMGEAAFWRTVTKRAAVAGFCPVEKERDRTGRVIALNPLNPAWSKAVPQGRGVFAWQYRVAGSATIADLAPEDVIVFRWTEDPEGSPYGVSPLTPLARDVAMIGRLQNFLSILLAGGGVPLYGLIPDVLPGATLDQEGVDGLLAGFLARHGGIERASVPLVLEGIKDVKRLGFDLDELAYTDIRDVIDLAIAQACGVPPTKAWIRVGLEHSEARANADIHDRAFYRDTIVPLWSAFDDALSTGLLPEFAPTPNTLDLRFDDSHVQALQDDRNARAPWLVQGFAAGAFSQATLFRELGIPEPETPDFYLRGLATDAVPADDPLPAASPPVASPAATGTQAASRNGVHRSAGAGNGPVHRLAAAGAAAKRAHQRIAAAREPDLAAFFAAQGRRIVASLALAATGPTVRLALADIDWARENRELQTVLAKLYRQAAAGAFHLASDQVGVDIAFDVANPKLQDAMNRLAGRVVGITTESRSQIAAAVTAANERGASVDELRADLTALFGSWSESRAAVCARTESMVSFGVASKLAYEQSGIVDRIQCFDSPTHCDDYGADDQLSCCERNGLIDTLDSADLHIDSEHPNGSLSIAPVLIGAEA